MQLSRYTLYDLMIASSPRTKFDIYTYNMNSKKFEYINRDEFSNEILSYNVTMQCAIDANCIRVYVQEPYHAQ